MLASRLYRNGLLVVNEIEESNDAVSGSINRDGQLMSFEIDETDDIESPMRITKNGIFKAKEFSEFLEDEIL